MHTIFLILWLITFVAGYGCFLNYILHMFQQNSYKREEHLHWVKVNYARLMGKFLFALISVPFLWVGNSVCLVIAILCNVVTILLNKPGKTAKKPLVYTPRVKRMIVTAWLCFLIVLACFFLLGMNQVMRLVCVACLVILPVWITVINGINHPVEEHINRGFIKEASDIIESMPGLTIIGVTGSYGKTSVKYFLSKLLSTKFNVLHTPGNYNTTLGVVRTIRGELKAYHDIFICEMGARQVNDIREICDLVHPRYGIITSIGPQHLQSFHTIENVVKTKFELADAIPSDGCIFLNNDNSYIAAHKGQYEGKTRICTYGVEDTEAKYRAYDITVSASGSAFKMKDAQGKEYEFNTRLMGKHNVENIAGAIAVANTLGIAMEKLIYPVRQLESVPHRLQLQNQGNRIILDDSYNSNKNGFMAALDTLQGFQEIRILFTPGMVELGEKQYSENKEAGVYAADKCDYVVLVGREQTKPIYDGLLEAGFPEHKIIIVEGLMEGFDRINGIPSEDRKKVVLIENDLPDNYS
ncbi:MAG: UDP-N-acetylmuramoyl-tripeptide--D-alanyl-D-alanine ligase [Lachnospiraceae bacterium]|nr:UDP-N-acetylmuramoyl-tripeptide--D-alanyl-D-alanine ligase [Lachnospiraceae bacterium]